MLAEKKYTQTKDDPKFLTPLEPKSGYEPSEKEQAIIKKINDRYRAMQSARAKIDNDWKIYQLVIEGKYYPYMDGRTSVNVPIFRALQELFVSEATARKMDREILPIGMSDIEKASVITEVVNVDWDKNRREEQMTEAEYQCSAYGTCAYYTGFCQTERIIYDPEVKSRGEIEYRKKLMREGRIILETVDIRNVYFDDRASKFDDCVDEILIEYISSEQFRMEMGEYENTEYVGTMAKDNLVFTNFEEAGKSNNDYVQKLHYWNKQSDSYIVLYNGKIIGRNDHIPYAHKELPIVPRQYGKVMNSIYGRGLAEACLQFLDKYNRLSEMIFDGIARSNNSMFAVGNGLTFEGGKISFNNQVLKFNGQLNDANFRELRGQQPNNSAFEQLKNLLEEIAIFVGIDISQIIGTPNGTAFETAQKLESSLKRVNVVLTNRDYAMSRVMKLHLANIMQFIPIAYAEEITETGTESFNKILLDGKKYIPETGKIVDNPGKFEFECKPEYIRGQFDITIKTNFNQPTLRAMKQDEMNKFLNDFSLYSQVSMASPDLAKIIKPDDFIKQLAYTYNIDINAIGGMQDSYGKQYDELMNKYRESQGNTMPTGTPGQPPPPMPGQPNGSSTGMDVLPNVSQTGLPPVKTPEIPSISDLGAGQKIML